MLKQFLESNANNFYWGLAAFVIFVIFVIPMAVRKILAAVDAREAKIAADLKEAENAYARAKTVQAEVDAKFASAESKIAAMMAESRKDAENQKADMIEKGRQDIESLRVRSLRDIEAARHSALIGLRQEIADISMAVAEKIVRESLDASRHEALISQTMDAYAASRESK